jgi:hypothetical protein
LPGEQPGGGAEVAATAATASARSASAAKVFFILVPLVEVTWTGDRRYGVERRVRTCVS